MSDQPKKPQPETRTPPPETKTPPETKAAPPEKKAPPPEMKAPPQERAVGSGDQSAGKSRSAPPRLESGATKSPTDTAKPVDPPKAANAGQQEKLPPPRQENGGTKPPADVAKPVDPPKTVTAGQQEKLSPPEQDSGKTTSTRPERPSNGQASAKERTHVVEGPVPVKAERVLEHVRAHDAPPHGHAGGREYRNAPSRLPERDSTGQPISYKEWDVNPRVKGVDRGRERLVTGSDGSAYYTDDHYATFMAMRRAE